MKKILIGVAAMALAFGAKAATFNWTSSAVVYGVDAAAVVDNGDYAAGTTKMRNGGTWAYVVTIFEAGSTTELGSTSGTIAFGSTGKINTTFTVDGTFTALSTYDYVIELTGTQTTLTSRGIDGAYDYSGATLAATVSGEVSIKAAGNSPISMSAPATWTVSGITPVPEPTSGLLMLLGMAGLALRRRRA